MNKGVVSEENIVEGERKGSLLRKIFIISLLLVIGFSFGYIYKGFASKSKSERISSKNLSRSKETISVTPVHSFNKCDTATNWPSNSNLENSKASDGNLLYRHLDSTAHEIYQMEIPADISAFTLPVSEFPNTNVTETIFGTSHFRQAKDYPVQDIPLYGSRIIFGCNHVLATKDPSEWDNSKEYEYMPAFPMPTPKLITVDGNPAYQYKYEGIAGEESTVIVIKGDWIFSIINFSDQLISTFKILGPVK